MPMPRACLCLAMLFVAIPARADDLTTRAMNVLADNCLACHNPEKHKSNLTLTTRDAALTGGDNGPALVPGKPADSPLITSLAADADPHMPPKKQLAAGEVDTLNAWVTAGAPWDVAALTARAKPAATQPVTLRPLPSGYHPVLALALSPDQKKLAFARGDHVLVYDLTAKPRKPMADLATPNDVAFSLAFSADGRALASGHFRAVRLWDLKSGNPTRTLAGPPGRVSALAFTPDGATLLAADGEPAMPGVVRAFNPSTGEPLRQWTAHADAVAAMKLDTAGKTLLTAGADKLVKTWSIADGKELAKFEGHVAQVMAVAFSRDGKQIASAGADKEIKIWDLATRDQVTALVSNPAGVTDVLWLDDKRLLNTAEDGTLRVTNVDNKTAPERTFTDAPDVLYAAVADKSGTLYAACHDGFVYVYSNNKLETKLP